MSQNIWKLQGSILQRQRRRAQIIRRSIDFSKAKTVLDIGCAEGFATSYMRHPSRQIVAIELDLSNLRVAKNLVTGVAFVNASISNLPFRPEVFNAVCVLEVLEHLSDKIQLSGLSEVDHVLKPEGILMLSVPYKEKVIETTCIHCNKKTPLYGHLHSMDEEKLEKIVPSTFNLRQVYHMPNIESVSCSSYLKRLPLSTWLFANQILGLIRKGYWIVLLYRKNR